MRTMRIFPAAAALLLASLPSSAANHREAPITALDHKADITDVYAFVSYGPDQRPNEPPRRVTLIMGVDPLLEPANGPTLFPFDPGILYELHVDNDNDARADVTFQFRFQTSYGLPGVYTAVAGFGPNGAPAPGGGGLVVPPRITGFDSPGLNQRQTYTATLIKNGVSTPLINDDGTPFFAVPANAGERTMDYGSLFKQGTYFLSNGVALFAGTTDDAFWIDLGATFDTANFRTLGSGVPGVLTAAEDAAAQNFASDTVSGYAVNHIAVEVPIALLTRTGQVEPPDSVAATVGVWATTSRRAEQVRQAAFDRRRSADGTGRFRQVQRMGNPLINEVIIGIGSKDFFSMQPPSADAQFASVFLNPPVVRIVEALYGGALKVPAPPRTDLLPLVTYAPPIAAPGTPAGPVADLLRLNTGVAATPPAQARRLGLLAGDRAGFPNGRRPIDDVTDIALRVVVGGVLAAPFPGYTPGVNDRLGDGVNVNDQPNSSSFPYLAGCPDGRNRRHVDPGEPGGGPVSATGSGSSF